MVARACPGPHRRHGVGNVSRYGSHALTVNAGWICVVELVQLAGAAQAHAELVAVGMPPDVAAALVGRARTELVAMGWQAPTAGIPGGARDAALSLMDNAASGDADPAATGRALTTGKPAHLRSFVDGTGVPLSESESDSAAATGPDAGAVEGGACSS